MILGKVRVWVASIKHTTHPSDTTSKPYTNVLGVNRRQSCSDWLCGEDRSTVRNHRRDKMTVNTLRIWSEGKNEA